MNYKLLVSAALVTAFFSKPAQARYWMCVGSERAWDTLLISEVLDDTKNPYFKEDWAVAAQKYWHSLGRDQVVSIGRVCDDYATYDEAQAGVKKALIGIGWKSRTLVPLVPVKDAKRDNSGRKLSSDDMGRAKTLVMASGPAASRKYVEVPGPNGVMRLSPEVAARNKAAAEEYQRKIKEHSEAVALAKANNERRAAEHATALARHAESVAETAAEMREYERKLAANAAEIAARKANVENNLGGTEGTFQATSKFRATREEAMYEMTSHPRAPISNVQCKEVTFYKPARWTCWGTYREVRTRSSTSKQ